MATDPRQKPIKILPLPPPRSAAETILIVEDEEMQREMLSLLLSEKGYAILTASDGAEAVEVFRLNSGRITLVILDIGLPRQNGVDAFLRIKEINPAAPVIFATGYIEQELRTQVMECGARAFLAKPYRPLEILQTVRNVIEAEKLR
jgi:two-component system cell cycle sensor histidine kinase/response regulator CckA